MIPLHVELGKELPELAWWHENEDDAAHLTERFRRPEFEGWGAKPLGGLWTAPLRDFGRGLPDSQWAQFAQAVNIRKAQDQRYVSTVVPDPGARFVVIDTQADAVAAAQAFPSAAGSGLLAEVLGSHLEEFKEKVPDPSPFMGGLLGYGDRAEPVIDWTGLEAAGYAGVYLTLLGNVACHLPDGTPGVPSFWGWDVETVWFATPSLRVTDTAQWVAV